MVDEVSISEKPDSSYCPECGSAQIHFRSKHGDWLCLDCDHEWRDKENHRSATPSSGPMRIFLSYGHDANEELVRLIKVDLEERGHDVWFDKTEIKAGDDWRRAITDGIERSHKVLSFLSKHSTRDPGVCRDEIAIAIGVKGGNIQTILVESEEQVQPPVNIGHIQWLDMHEWKERRAESKASWEEWYHIKLTEIIRVVESDESRRFAGEIETLQRYLKPIKSDARIYELLRKGFIGRTWLFEALEKWRHDENRESRLFWITGDPGVGKSTFAAQLTHTCSNVVIAAQFVEWNKRDHHDPRRVVLSIAFQLATRLPDYRKFLLTLPEITRLDSKNPAELFDYLLANPLNNAIGGGRERSLIVIDALDEAGENGHNPFVEMLASNSQHLPKWLGIVVTSRPESTVMFPLQGLKPFVLDTRTEANQTDLRDYLQRQLAPQLKEQSNPDTLLDQILQKSEGVFLYVERFCDDVQQKYLSLDNPEQFPQGLGRIFAEWFQRQFPNLVTYRQEVRPALRTILAAREPLPLEILQDLFQWQDEEAYEFIRTLGSMFPVTKEENFQVIKPYHKSLEDWLSDEAIGSEYYVSSKEGHRMLAKHGLHLQEAGSTLNRKLISYLERNLLYHAVESTSMQLIETVIQQPTLLSSVYSINIGDFVKSSTEFGTALNRLSDHGDLYTIYYAIEALGVRTRSISPKHLGYDYVHVDSENMALNANLPSKDILWNYIGACKTLLDYVKLISNKYKCRPFSYGWKDSFLNRYCDLKDELERIDSIYYSNKYFGHLAFRAQEVSENWGNAMNQQASDL